MTTRRRDYRTNGHFCSFVLKSFIAWICVFVWIVEGGPGLAQEDQVLRVGVYNFEPLIFVDEDGQPRGLYLDVLEYVAGEEDWQIEYVPGSWAECLECLEKGQIDLLPSIGYTKERAQMLDFTQEYLFLDWGVVYQPKGQSIETILDLEGLRVAALKNSVYTEGLRNRLEQFGVHTTIVEKAEYTQVMDAVNKSEVDAGIITKIYGLRLESTYPRVEATEVVFSPIKIYFAAPKDTQEALLGTLDTYLVDLKADKDSIYYTSLRKWMDDYHQESHLSPWLLWSSLIVLGLLAFFFSFSLILQRRVRQKTLALTDELSERKQIQKALQESEMRYRSLVETAPDLIAIHVDGKIAFINPSGARLLGASDPAEVIDKPVADFIAPVGRDAARRRMQRLSHADIGAISPVYEQKLLRLDGQERDIEVVGVSFRYQGQNAVQLLVRDITARKQAEADLKTALAEKETLLRELYHRTKNNMNVICALLDLYAAEAKEPYVVEVFNEMTRRIRSMSLVHQMLYRSQNLSRVDLGTYVEELIVLLMRSYRMHDNIKVVTTVEEVPVLIDTALPCGLILTELISNVVKHAFPDHRQGEVQIQVRQAEDDIIELRVADNGVGLPQGMDVRHAETMGLQTIFSLGESQLRGQVAFMNQQGFCCLVRFSDTLYQARV